MFCLNLLLTPLSFLLELALTLKTIYFYIFINISLFLTYLFHLSGLSLKVIFSVFNVIMMYLLFIRF